MEMSPSLDTIGTSDNSFSKRQVYFRGVLLPLPPKEYRISIVVVCGVTLLIIAWVPFIYIYLWLKYPHKVNRISVRQMVVIGVVNIVQTIFGILSPTVWPVGDGCRIILWLFNMTRNITTWVAFTVALNLQLVICHNIRDTRKFEPYYYGVSTVIGLVPFIVSISVNSQPDVVVADYCLNDAVVDPASYALYWPWGIIYTLVAIVASLVSIGYILVYIFRTRMGIIKNKRETFDSLEDFQQQIKHKGTIERVNENIAIQEPKTALVPPMPRWTVQNYDQFPLISKHETAIHTRIERSSSNREPSPVLTRDGSMLPISQQYVPVMHQDQSCSYKEQSQEFRSNRLEQDHEQRSHNKLPVTYKAVKHRVYSLLRYPKESILEARAKYRIISPILLRLLWVPLAPLFSFFFEVAANTVGARDEAQTHQWLHGLADGLFFFQATIQAYPFYKDTIIIETLKIERKSLIFKHLYIPCRRFIMERLEDDESRRAQLRRVSYSNVFSRERELFCCGRAHRVSTPLSTKSVGSSNRDEYNDTDKTENNSKDIDESKSYGEVEMAILELLKFTAGIGGGGGGGFPINRRQESLAPKFESLKKKLKFYFVRYILLTKSERRVYKMVFGPSRDNSDAQDI